MRMVRTGVERAYGAGLRDAMRRARRGSAFMAMAENPEFTGHIIDAINCAPNRDELSGQTLIGAEVALELGVQDRGKDRPSHREMLGSPRPKNPAAVY